nr:MAG TPA: hypothetical protein [Caudoviricetes sp.]
MAGSAHKYTHQELNALTIEQIKKIAGERHYGIIATLKSEIISQFLAQQGV